MIPSIRPSSTRKLASSSATVSPNALRSPRASMQAIVLALLLLGGLAVQAGASRAVASCEGLVQLFDNLLYPTPIKPSRNLSPREGRNGHSGPDRTRFWGAVLSE